jgi:hypothetical protein
MGYGIKTNDQQDKINPRDPSKVWNTMTDKNRPELSWRVFLLQGKFKAVREHKETCRMISQKWIILTYIVLSYSVLPLNSCY